MKGYDSGAQGKEQRGMFARNGSGTAATLQTPVVSESSNRSSEIRQVLRHQPLLQTEHSETLRLLQILGLRLLIGQSPAFLAIVGQIPKLARCEANVLISGEAGSGKEVCARAIHYLSPRSGKPFIAVSCSAIPAKLVENELFGHERGAYTDAGNGKPGVIVEAEGGTLLLKQSHDYLEHFKLTYTNFDGERVEIINRNINVIGDNKLGAFYKLHGNLSVIGRNYYQLM